MKPVGAWGAKRMQHFEEATARREETSLWTQSDQSLVSAGWPSLNVGEIAEGRLGQGNQVSAHVNKRFVQDSSA